MAPTVNWLNPPLPSYMPVPTIVATGFANKSLCRLYRRPDTRPAAATRDDPASPRAILATPRQSPGTDISDGISGLSGASSIRLRCLKSWTRMPRSERCSSVVPVQSVGSTPP